MSVNKYKPHVYVLPEDDADRQIADGFVLHPRVLAGQVRVVAPAGGWSRVLDTFKEEYLPLLKQNLNTYVVLVIDFDGSPADRQKTFNKEIPEEVRSRVFVIGPRETPEVLRRSLGKGYEDIGRCLADECDGENFSTWQHEQLQHNDSERQGLVDRVKPFFYF